MTADPRIDTDERRRRLVVRHHLDRTAEDVETAIGALLAVHSSDPITPYLALRARVPGFAVADLDRVLYDERTAVRVHAMRRTLFVVPTAEAAVLHAACGRKVARTERAKVERWVADALTPDGADGPYQGGDPAHPADPIDPIAWLADLERRTLAVLADGALWRTQDLTAAVPGLELRLTLGSGRWAGETPLSSRLLFVLALEGKVVRAHPSGSWLSSQYHWSDAASWADGDDRARAPVDPAEGRRLLARDWLAVHGPATTVDLRWWAGWTVRETEAALRDVGAVAVDLAGGGSGWVLPDDVEPIGGVAPGVALLPGLDPTTMAWKERDWYLGPHAAALFDRNGNAGPTIWVAGRVVGAWAQRRGGEVVTRLLEDVGADAERHVEEEAAALTAWFGGLTVTPRFRTPLERELAG